MDGCTILILLLITLKVYQLLTKGRCRSPVCLVGKTALITGGNSGIGYQAALGLAARGCRVIIADKDNCEETKRKIIEETGNGNVIIKTFDLASFKSVRRLAADINSTEERLDILINNAGIGQFGKKWTEDGLNFGMQVNHFGPFLLTHLLIDLLKKSAPSRIIFVSSIGAFLSNLTVENLNPPPGPDIGQWMTILMYGNSKLCNIITAKEISKKLRGSGVTVNAVHPGLVHTPIFRKSLKSYFYLALYYVAFYPLSKNAEEGAQTSLYVAMSKEVEKESGKYFVDCRPFLTPSNARSDSFSREIFEKSEELVKLAPEERL